jgi:predicted Zn-dependent protease
MAAVLGHEIGHVTARHAAQQYTRSMLTQVVLVAGTVYMEAEETEHREIYTFAGMLGASLLMARYSRDQERQSDDLGFDYMVNAGYNPQGMIGVMEVLAAQSKAKPNLFEKMFASHPQSSARLDKARQLVAAAPPEVAERPLHEEKYQARVREVVKARPAYDRFVEASQSMGEKKYAEAIALFSQSVDEWPNDGLLRAGLAVAQGSSKKHQAAMRNSARAAEDAPGIFQVQAIAGETFFRNKKYSEALGFLDQASVALPNQAPVELMRGQAFEKLSRRDEAVQAYRRVLRLAPQSQEAAEATKGLRRLGEIQ